MSAVGATDVQTIGNNHNYGSWVMGHVGLGSVHWWVRWVMGHKMWSMHTVSSALLHNVCVYAHKGFGLSASCCWLHAVRGDRSTSAGVLQSSRFCTAIAVSVPTTEIAYTVYKARTAAW